VVPPEVVPLPSVAYPGEDLTAIQGVRELLQGTRGERHVEERLQPPWVIDAVKPRADRGRQWADLLGQQRQYSLTGHPNSLSGKRLNTLSAAA